LQNLTLLIIFAPVMGIAERKEKQKTELKNLILEASVKLFSEQGYEGFSIRKIAEMIEYSPTTVYLYYKDKNEILFDLHEIGFRKFADYNRAIFDISNPLVRLHKLGENYIRFGVENPEFYNLMFILPAPMEALSCMNNEEWKGGDDALNLLKSILQECMDRKLILNGDLNSMAMAIWGMVHGLVSLAIRKRFAKLVDEEEVIPTMNKSLNWLINVLDRTN
jgi:AcrR family transcriptional regulator